MRSSYFGNTPVKKSMFKGGVSIVLSTPDWYPGLRYEKLAPTPYLVSIKEDVVAFEKGYREDILSKLDPAVVWCELMELTAPEEPVLLGFKKDPDACPRGVIRKWFEETLGEEVKEGIE